MTKRPKKSQHAFFERGSWYHRTKIIRDDYSVGYGKAGGFKSREEAEAAYQKHMEEFGRLMKTTLVEQGETITIKEYLVYWFKSVFSERVESTTQYTAAYVLYTFILPSIQEDIKLRLVSAGYLDDVLAGASKYCASAGNKSRELLYIAFKDAVAERMITNNPVPDTKKYPRKKPKIQILDKEQARVLLSAAKERNWFLEILLGLYLGLRKGEILGLKFGDFNTEERTVHIQRQLAADITVEKYGGGIEGYALVERDPKTEKSNRVLRVPTIIMVELEKRRLQVEAQKAQMEDAYRDNGYISCQKNGLPHGLASLNTELTRLCERNSLPHITVHGLRHMFATILLEQGVSIAKISGMLGHSSVHTTFEFYLDVMDADEKIMQFMNTEFAVETEQKGA